ncbi:MAG: TrkH family potassium uptake protein, partial [Planctomycetaceae bacterium]
MNTEERFSSSPSWEGTIHPEWAHRLVRLEGTLQLVGVVLVVARFGIGDSAGVPLGIWMTGYLLVVLGMTGGFVLRYLWSRRRGSFLRENWHLPMFSLLWLVGCFVSAFAVGALDELTSSLMHWPAMITWTEWIILAQGVIAFVSVVKGVSAHGYNPTLILVLSFVILIGIGTILLMMPRSRVQLGETPRIDHAPFLTALYTSTSASCVTGLAIVHTGDYWTRFGQTVIMGLIQIGGLGIMTFGAIFAIAAGRKLEIREAATFQNLLESERMRDVPRMIGAIAAVTFGTELIGAALLTTLWPELPWSERMYYGLFHAVSSFCNAGFTLTPDNLVGMADRWQVWGVISSLIIIGGLGFAVNYNILLVFWSKIGQIRSNPLFDLPRTRLRLTLSSKMVLSVTGSLLVLGTIGVLLLEATSPGALRTLGERIDQKLANAWFQSVTCRTAGFNAVDIGQLNPATKLFSIILMFIGASPGSTGGGVKT